MYLFNAKTFLIDVNVYAWSSPALAVGAALAFLAVFWVAYDLICRWVGEKSGQFGGDLLGALHCLDVSGTWRIRRVLCCTTCCSRATIAPCTSF